MIDVILSGFWPHATAEAAHALVSNDPGLRPVFYSSPRPGVLARADGGEVALGGDPATAVLRDGVALGEPGRVLIVLPEGFEPDHTRTAWQTYGDEAALRVVTAVPADLILDGLTDDTALHTVGLHQDPDDERCIGEVIARQLEQADTVLLTGQAEGDDWEAEQLRILLRRIAPWSHHCGLADATLPAAGRREPIAPTTRGLRGYAAGVHEPVPEHGVVACVFRARRPFHPGRLHDALDEVTQQVVRSRGHFWLASRPDLVMSWESAAGLRLGPVSGWLADLPGEHWAAVDSGRCLAAEIDWNPFYGDRSQHLAFVGVDVDPDHIHRTLADCLLTNAELAQGAEAWQHLADPFRRSYPACAAGSPAQPFDTAEGNRS